MDLNPKPVWQCCGLFPDEGSGDVSRFGAERPAWESNPGRLVCGEVTVMNHCSGLVTVKCSIKG